MMCYNEIVGKLFLHVHVHVHVYVGVINYEITCN